MLLVLIDTLKFGKSEFLKLKGKGKRSRGTFEAMLDHQSENSLSLIQKQELLDFSTLINANLLIGAPMTRCVVIMKAW